MKFWLALIALLSPAAALAADQVSLTSEVFVERTRPGPDGKTVTVRETPGVVTPGERLFFALRYANGGSQPATGFALTNPIPDAVRFVEAEGAPALSVDGGKNWGTLGELEVALPDGTSRPAEAADVTHIRWSFAQPIPAGSGGSLSFRGVVK